MICPVRTNNHQLAGDLRKRVNNGGVAKKERPAMTAGRSNQTPQTNIPRTTREFNP
jgi:hypothetical protein